MISFLAFCFVVKCSVSSGQGLRVHAHKDYFGIDDDIIPPQNIFNSTDYSVPDGDNVPSATFVRAPVLDPRWPDATVPYVFHRTVGDSDRKQTIRAMKEYHKHSCVNFKNWTGEPDYLTIEYSQRGECSSFVGRQGGPQPLYLGLQCARSLGVVMHELMHALGFTHEHMRPDRDKYVYINFSNIDRAYWNNFQIDSSNDIYLGAPYDFGSLMHYRLVALSNNSLPTVIPKVNPRTKVIGQRIGFSKKDVIKLNRLYNCTLEASYLDVAPAENKNNSLYDTKNSQETSSSKSNSSVYSESKANSNLPYFNIIFLAYTYKHIFLISL